MFSQEWNSTLDSSSRYEYYRTFKTLLQPEKYLSLITKYKLRTVFVKYRLGLLPLMINKGRKTSIEKEYRFCPFCKDVVENEIHFTLVCPCYHDLREICIPNHVLVKQPLDAYKYLLQTTNVNIITQLSLFIKHALAKRDILVKQIVHPVISM